MTENFEVNNYLLLTNSTISAVNKILEPMSESDNLSDKNIKYFQKLLDIKMNLCSYIIEINEINDEKLKNPYSLFILEKRYNIVKNQLINYFEDILPFGASNN